MKPPNDNNNDNNDNNVEIVDLSEPTITVSDAVITREAAFLVVNPDNNHISNDMMWLSHDGVLTFRCGATVKKDNTIELNGASLNELVIDLVDTIRLLVEVLQAS